MPVTPPITKVRTNSGRAGGSDGASVCVHHEVRLAYGMCSVHGHGDDTEAAINLQPAPSLDEGCPRDASTNDKCKAYIATVRHCHWNRTCVLLILLSSVHPGRRKAIVHVQRPA
eukprot:scaffold34637_cov63-Phaeocystis_antarctica.AAC.1